jgi:hypothetical protein
MEDLDDSGRPTAEQLQATPMSVPPKGRIRKAKYDFSQVPREAYYSIKVYDRNGNEQKDMVEFDPETGNGKRIRDGNIEDCYLYNGYVVAGGLAHPDEYQLPEIIESVRKEAKLKGSFSSSSSSRSRIDSLKTNPVDSTPADSLRCPKCQSKIRFDQDQKAIVCSNGNCGMKWHSNGDAAGVSQGGDSRSPQEKADKDSIL